MHEGKYFPYQMTENIFQFIFKFKVNTKKYYHFPKKLLPEKHFSENITLNRGSLSSKSPCTNSIRMQTNELLTI